jgi:sugar lactone lactonase YvrE
VTVLRGATCVLGGVIVLTVSYFLLWPVPVQPVAWQAPADLGFIDPFASNALLQRAQAIDIGAHEGPEDLAAGSDGHLYSTSVSGAILRYSAGGKVEVFAETGGRPLGIEADVDGSLLVANAYLGLQRISRDGSVTTILDSVNGQALVYADDLAVAADGTIYFSEATTKFGVANNGGSYVASLLDINEHGGHGLLIAFDPATGETRILLDGLNFANGVAISEDQSFLLLAETGAYRILKHWLLGPDAGRTEVLLDNLPAFPDNINTGRNGRFWIGLIAPRNEFIDRFSGSPFVRKIMQRLPERFRPRAIPHSQVIAISGDGDVLMNLHDASARFPSLTGVLETSDTLYLTSLFGHQLAYIRKQDL